MKIGHRMHLRHGFASYHLARFNDAAALALTWARERAFSLSALQAARETEAGPSVTDDRACCNG